MDRMDSTFKPALTLMSGNAVAAAVSFVIPLVLVRIFEPGEFGTYKQLILLYVTLYGIAQLGMAESLFYFLPSAPRQGGRYACNALLLLAAAGAACLVLLEAAGPAIARWFNNDDLSRYLPLIGWYAVLTLIAAVLEIVMIARGRYRAAAWSYAVTDVVRTICFVAPVLATWDLAWMLYGAIAFAALRCAATLAYLGWEFDDGFRPDAGLMRAQWAYTVPFQLAVIADVFQANLHQYAVSFYFDAATFAVYAVACLQVPVVDIVTNSAANVMMVKMGENTREGRHDAVLAIWHDAVRKLAMILFPLVALLLVSAPELIVLLFTDSYRASIPLFMIWSTLIVFAVLMTDGALRVYADTRFLFVCHAVRLLVILSLIHWFLSVFQLAGAILAMIVATAVMKAMGLARMSRVMRVSLSRLLPWRHLAMTFAVAAAAGLCALLIKSALALSLLPLLLITGGLYAAAYLMLLWHVGLLRDDERAVVVEWLRRLEVGAARAGIIQRR